MNNHVQTPQSWYHLTSPVGHGVFSSVQYARFSSLSLASKNWIVSPDLVQCPLSRLGCSELPSTRSRKIYSHYSSHPRCEALVDCAGIQAKG